MTTTTDTTEYSPYTGAVAQGENIDGVTVSLDPTICDGVPVAWIRWGTQSLIIPHEVFEQMIRDTRHWWRLGPDETFEETAKRLTNAATSASHKESD